MSTKDQNTEMGKTPEAAAERKPFNRRALLKGSIVSLPAVLTLQSGAALARSSNLISGTSTGATDAQGRTLCLDVDSVYPASEHNEVYDLGEQPYGRVSAINDRDYRDRPRWHSNRVSEAQMCKNGGRYYYKRQWSGWTETRVPRGVLVSATALTSFAGDIVITDL
jgi:hypothetical protein